MTFKRHLALPNDPIDVADFGFPGDSMSQEVGRYDVPDYPTAMVGWRWFSVVGPKYDPFLPPRLKGHRPVAFRLASLHKVVIWKPGEPMVAECRRDDFGEGIGGHADPPVPGCTCGIYALKDRDDLLYRGLALVSPVSPIFYVLTQVAMWGRIIPGEKGYKAQYAYPLRIFVPTLDGDSPPPERDDVSHESLTTEDHNKLADYLAIRYRVPAETTPFSEVGVGITPASYRQTGFHLINLTTEGSPRVSTNELHRFTEALDRLGFQMMAATQNTGALVTAFTAAMGKRRWWQRVFSGFNDRILWWSTGIQGIFAVSNLIEQRWGPLSFNVGFSLLNVTLIYLGRRK